ncbi:Protein of unknown function [Escherichia coli D6-113.11]|nr:Protein of unknown function [Escherichia coli D6-113.11]CDU35129.1 Protein of unknown function [Escherichia coli D6-113.11]
MSASGSNSAALV